jgi:YesN/AraC family two-component response regulator
VEDNYEYRNYLVEVLSDYYNVKTASEGNEALKKLEHCEADIVLSDMMMPGMNGLEFAQRLRERENYRQLPVIFLSAKNTIADIEAGLGSGADVYLTKPIENKMLLAQIAAILRREKLLEHRSEHTQEEPTNGLEPMVREIVIRHLANPALSVNLLADALYISRTKLYRDWKEVSDITLNDYIKQLRMEEARILISEKGFAVKEAARAVGYLKSGYFSTSFKQQFGISPSQVTD